MTLKDKMQNFNHEETKIHKETYSYNKVYLVILIIITIFSPIAGYYVNTGIDSIIYGWLIGMIGFIVGVYAITHEIFHIDFSKLKYVFTPNESPDKKIMNFKEDRVNKINKNESPIIFEEKLKLIVHLIPLNAFSGVNYNLSDIEYNQDVMDNLLPIYPGSATQYLGCHYNLDGFLVHEVPKEGSFAYVQLFRNGIIESVLAAYPNHRKRINVVYNERDIILFVTMYLKVLQTLGIKTPIKIFLTITGAKGYSMYSLSSNAVKIDKDILYLPEISIENYDDEIERIFKPLFDIIWNACGHGKSPNYDQNDEWIRP